MDWRLFPYASVFYVGAAAMVALGATAWQYRSLRTAAITAFLLWGMAAWALFYGLGVNSLSMASKTWFSKLEYLPIVVLPTLWLSLVLEYTGRGHWRTRSRVALLSIVPAVTLALVLSNERHGLIWTKVDLVPNGPFLLWEAEYGPAFWTYAAYSYCLVMVGMALLARTAAASPSAFRLQGLALAGSALVPLLGNVLYISDVDPIPRYLVSFTTLFAGTLLIWLLFRFRFLTVVPIAKSWILDNMSDGVIVLDSNNVVVDINSAAQRLTQKDARSVIGRPVAEAMTGLRLELPKGHDSAVSELNYEYNGQPLVCELTVSPLFDSRKRLKGRTMVLRDVTLRKRAEEVLQRGKEDLELKVEERTTELLRAAAELRQSRHRLVTTQEDVRKEVASQLHGPVQTRLLVVRHRLVGAAEAARAGDATALESLGDCARVLDEIIAKELRAAIQRLHPSLIRMDFLASLEMLCSGFRQNLAVDVCPQKEGLSSPDLWRTSLPEGVRLAMYRVTEEALTNTLKHAAATAVTVALEEPREGEVSVSIRDNGKGFQPDRVVPGFGTLSMHDYCGAQDGSLTVESQPGRGTTVIARFQRSAHEDGWEVAGGPKAGATGFSPDSDPAGGPKAGPTGGAGTEQKTTVLVVDDQPDFCDFARDLLMRTNDFQVVAVGHNGQEAVRLAQEHRPEVVLMDVEMPVKNGLEATRDIMTLLPGTKVVLVSAYHQREFLQRAFEYGALTLIPKSEMSVERLRAALTTSPPKH